MSLSIEQKQINIIVIFIIILLFWYSRKYKTTNPIFTLDPSDYSQGTLILNMVNCSKCHNGYPIGNQVPLGTSCSSLGDGWLDAGHNFDPCGRFRCDAGHCLKCHPNNDGDYPEICMPYVDCVGGCQSF